MLIPETNCGQNSQPLCRETFQHQYRYFPLIWDNTIGGMMFRFIHTGFGSVCPGKPVVRRVSPIRNQWCRTLLIAQLLCFCIINGFTQEAELTGFQVEDHTIYSDTLGCYMPIRVLIPDAYRWDDETYITLYAMDDSPDDHLAALVESVIFIHMDVLPVIVVRLPMGPIPDGVDTGQLRGDDWIKFLETSLFPFVESRYRVIPYRILAGDRLSTTMALEMSMSHPTLFSGLIAEAGGDVLPDIVPRNLPRPGKGNQERLVAVSVATTPGSGQAESFNRIKDGLDAQTGIRYRIQVNNRNVTTYQRKAGFFLQKGLEFCFRDWYVSNDLARLGLAGVLDHYQELSHAWQASIAPPKRLIDMLGIACFERNDYSGALAAFQYNVDQHPRSASVYGALGEAWEAGGRIHLAVIAYSQAFTLAEEYGHPWEDVFRKRLISTFKGNLIDEFNWNRAEDRAELPRQ